MTDYQLNYDVLKQVCRERSVIRNVSKHRKSDGTIDREGNLRIWNDAIARFKQTLLWEDGAPNYDDRDPLQPPPSLIFIPARGTGERRGTVIVACGGGFETRTGCEGFHVAEYFTDAGFNTAVLTYRLKPYSRWDAMADMQRAIRLLRARKEEFGITDKVAAMGFSAGGMLSANCATHFDLGDPAAADPVERESCRPDGAVLGYGAFAFAGAFAAAGFLAGAFFAAGVFSVPAASAGADFSTGLSVVSISFVSISGFFFGMLFPHFKVFAAVPRNVTLPYYSLSG